MGRRAKSFERLQLRCTRSVPNRCQSRRYYSVDCRTHRWRHSSACSARFLSRERSFFINIRYFTSDGSEETRCEEKNNMNLEEHEKYLGFHQPEETLCGTISTTFTPHKDFQLRENYHRLQQLGEGEPVQSWPIELSFDAGTKNPPTSRYLTEKMRVLSRSC